MIPTPGFPPLFESYESARRNSSKPVTRVRIQRNMTVNIRTVQNAAPARLMQQGPGSMHSFMAKEHTACLYVITVFSACYILLFYS